MALISYSVQALTREAENLQHTGGAVLGQIILTQHRDLKGFSFVGVLRKVLNSLAPKNKEDVAKPVPQDLYD